MRLPIVPIVFAALYLIPCSWSHAQSIPVVVSGITAADIQTADLYYDPNSGDVTLVTNFVDGIALTDDIGGALDFSSVDVVTFPDGTSVYSVPTLGNVRIEDASGLEDNQIAVFFPSNGTFNLGNILAPGAFTPQDFLDAFGPLDFRFQFPGGPTNQDGRSGISTAIRILPVAIPEPSCIVLLCLSATTALTRRRRKTVC